MAFGNSVPFYKMSGCGNDFIVIDNRELHLPVAQMASWARSLCKKSLGICADGLFFLEHAPRGENLAYRWHFFNRDGSAGEMCGNASRCAAWLAHEIGLAPAEHTFGTMAGPIRAKVIKEGPQAGEVEVRLPPPEKLRLNLPLFLDGEQHIVHSVVLGVPHAVIFMEDINGTDVLSLGRQLVHHDLFAPAGTNINFVQVKDDHRILIRTYERGVNDETFACGTGAAATQLVANRLGFTGRRADLITRGGEILLISVEDQGILLQGNACLTFKGEFYLNAMGLRLPALC